MPELSLEECPLRRPSQSAPRSRVLCRGPLRALRLCALSILLPCMLIAGPLYLRYRVYGDQLYPLAMSDMRLLDNKVSTTWCQRQLIKANTTFNAFLLPGTPQISHELQPFKMVRHLILEDDMKEYWGFYLLRGSTVTVSTCVRWPGASLIVIRGHKHLHECAYIGDNSSEELEELMENIKESTVSQETEAPSNTPGMMTRHRPWVHFHHPNHEKHKNHTLDHDQSVEDHETDPKIMKTLLGKLSLKVKDRSQKVAEENKVKDHIHKHRDQTVNANEMNNFKFEDPKTHENSEEVFQNVLKRLKKLGNRGQKILDKLNTQLADDNGDIKKVLDDVIHNNKEESVIKTRGRQWSKKRVQYEDSIDDSSRKKRDLFIKTTQELNKHDEQKDAALEEGFSPDGIADHRGVINETTLNDRSNSEFWSSFSSSEESLLNCEGLILNLPLTPHRYCEKQKSDDSLEEASLANTVTYRVPSNGYYFFVFNSENEIQPNYIRVQFHLKKAVYNVSNSVASCHNSSGSCALDLGFFSSEKLVLELPVKDNETLWNQEHVVVSECEPRTSVYMLCVVSVPLAIVLFAFQ